VAERIKKAGAAVTIGVLEKHGVLLWRQR
jgi:hypothetical protein